MTLSRERSAGKPKSRAACGFSGVDDASVTARHVHRGGTDRSVARRARNRAAVGGRVERGGASAGGTA